MPVTITINGDNANEAITEFATLSAAFTGQAQATATLGTTVVTEKSKSISQATRKTKPAEETEKLVEKIEKESEDESKGDSDQSIPDVVELRKAAAAVGTTPERKKQIKALLEQYKVKNVSTVPEDQRVNFLADLKAIGDE